jgi:hypothetical protein
MLGVREEFKQCSVMTVKKKKYQRPLTDSNQRQTHTLSGWNRNEAKVRGEGSGDHTCGASSIRAVQSLR